MARIRTIKPEFWSSPGVAKMSPWARLAFIAMWNWADDFGRGTYEPRELMGFIFPREYDMTVGEFQLLVGEIHLHVGVMFYSVSGRYYYEISTWKQHQKTDPRLKQSKYPAPSEGHPIDPTNMQVITPNNEPHQHVDVLRLHVDEPHQHVGAGTGEQGNRGTGEYTHDQTSGSIERETERITRFDEFWEACPRKVGKQKAREKYRAAVKRAGDEQTVIDGIHRLAQDPNLPEERFIPHPTTWLERNGWEDDPLPPRTTGGPFSTQPTTSTLADWGAPSAQKPDPWGGDPFGNLTVDHQESP